MSYQPAHFSISLGDMATEGEVADAVQQLEEVLAIESDEIAELVRDGADEDDIADAVSTYAELREDHQWVRDLLKDMEDYRADIAIHEDHFEAYIRDRVIEDLGGKSELPPMVSSHIDWAGVANDCRSDYTECAGYLFIAG